MKVRDLLQVLECGTDVLIYNSTVILIHDTYCGLSYTNFDEYFNMEIISINTSSDDCDIELVVR